MLGHVYCAFWSAAQWELLIKKCSFFLHMKPSCPSGYVPPAPLASPCAETPSGVSQLGLLPLLFPALQVVRSRGGGGGARYAPDFLSRGASSPPAGLRSSERGGSASGLLSVARSRFAYSCGSWRRVSCSFAVVFFMPATLLG